MIEQIHKINEENPTTIQCSCGRAFVTSKKLTKSEKFKKHLEEFKEDE